MMLNDNNNKSIRLLIDAFQRMLFRKENTILKLERVNSDRLYEDLLDENGQYHYKSYLQTFSEDLEEEWALELQDFKFSNYLYKRKLYQPIHIETPSFMIHQDLSMPNGVKEFERLDLIATVDMDSNTMRLLGEEMALGKAKEPVEKIEYCQSLGLATDPNRLAEFISEQERVFDFLDEKILLHQ